MLVMFGGTSMPIVVGSVQMLGHIALPVWLNLLGMACAIAGILYAITRRCPSCDADGIVTLRGPQRRCEECGTLFLNERFF